MTELKYLNSFPSIEGNSMIKCNCGGTFRPIEGLNGLWCDNPDCGAYRDGVEQKSVESSYTEDKLKSIRGVPVNRIIIGSESKGRLEISIPIFVSREEQKALIEQQLDLLQYTKEQIASRGLDIMPKR